MEFFPKLFLKVIENGICPLEMYSLRDESHIDFRTQCVIMTLAGERGIIATDVKKVIKFQSS